MRRCWIGLVVALILGGGCASTGFYMNAKGPDFATLAGFHQMQSPGHWQSASILSVDDLEVNRSWAAKPYMVKVRLTAGPHAVMCDYQFMRRFTGSLYTAEGLITADFEAGGEYVIDGMVSGDSVRIWIRDQKSRKPVSDIVTVKYKAKTEH